MTFAIAGEAVWSAVDQKPKSVRGRGLARVRWLRERPEATLLVDRYSDDWSELAWVQLIGRVGIVEGAAPPEELVSKYAQYRDAPPPGPLLRLDIERAVAWRAGEER
ncbi:MAG TPA: hypothetical protein VK919_06135 [Solirubrobacterales bacterium]|nr:hypothetical protein [Solirubrobacterales bacterium]